MLKWLFSANDSPVLKRSLIQNWLEIRKGTDVRKLEAGVSECLGFLCFKKIHEGATHVAR